MTTGCQKKSTPGTTRQLCEVVYNRHTLHQSIRGWTITKIKKTTLPASIYQYSSDNRSQEPVANKREHRAQSATTSRQATANTTIDYRERCWWMLNFGFRLSSMLLVVLDASRFLESSRVFSFFFFLCLSFGLVLGTGVWFLAF